MKSSIIVLVFTVSLLAVVAQAAEDEQDVVYLKNGSIIRGRITEEYPGQALKIQTADRNLFVFKTDDIERIVREGAASATQEPPSRSREGARFAVGARLGYFGPSNSALKEIYGGGVSLGVDLEWWSPTGFGSGLTFERYAKSGDPYINDPESEISSASARLSVIDVQWSALYRLNRSGGAAIPYLGIGSGIYVVHETVNIEGFYYGESASDSFNQSVIGFHAVGGLQIPTTSNVSFFFEGKYSTANVTGGNGAAGEDADIGGFTLAGGIRF